MHLFLSVLFFFINFSFLINLSPKGSISEHLIQSNPDFLCQISQRQTLSDRNMNAASGDGDCSLASCSLVSTMSELSAGVATGSELDNLIRAEYNLFKPSNFSTTENRAGFSKLCLMCN